MQKKGGKKKKTGKKFLNVIQYMLSTERVNGHIEMTDMPVNIPNIVCILEYH
jgi:hypothetical protein